MAGDGGVAALRVVVSGRVQGVFFRDSCRRLAGERGVCGWVRNRPDGAVEAWFEGEARAVDDLVTWCRSGPPHALVTSISVEPVAPVGARDFRVA